MSNRSAAFVVRFTQRDRLDEETGYTLGKYLYSLVEANDLPQLVINLGLVDYLDSLIIGKLFTLQKKVKAAGGRLVLCRVNPQLQELFDLVRLPLLIPIYADEEDALRAFENVKSVQAGRPHSPLLRKKGSPLSLWILVLG